MGKRKRSRSKDLDYDSILRKVKKLEHKLKERKKQRSPSQSTDDENSHYSEDNADLSLPGYISDEIVCLEEDTNTNKDSQHEQLMEPGPDPEPAEPNVISENVELENIPPPLEPEILQLLGENPLNQKKYGDNLHNDIAQRWTHILTNGLHKDVQQDLVKLYLPPENCPNIKPPKLNLEIKAALSEINVRKDLYSQSRQNQLASSLSAIGRVLNWTLESKGTVPQDIIKALSDAGRLICDSHYKESMSRRYAALNTLNKNIKDTIKNTQIDEHLFGSSLSDHIKSAKVISKTGSEIRPTPRPPYRTPPAIQPQRGALNSRGAPRVAVAEPRTTPAAPRRPPRDRRQDTTRGRRFAGYTRQQTRKR